MIRSLPAAAALPPAVLRLSRLAPLTDRNIAALCARPNPHDTPARRELAREGRPVGGARLILSGFAARTAIFADGRRQFLSFLLPGDLLGLCHQSAPLATSTVPAITPVTTCALPPTGSATLDAAYAVSGALDEAYLLRQIRRLGRLSAQARIADFLLEMHERLALAGLADQGGFELPFTQEVLADALGLTSVHINRMMQLLRREGDLEWKSGRVTLTDPAQLARKVGRTPVQVTTTPGA